jgi:hypothetical protein
MRSAREGLDDCQSKDTLDGLARRACRENVARSTRATAPPGASCMLRRKRRPIGRSRRGQRPRQVWQVRDRRRRDLHHHTRRQVRGVRHEIRHRRRVHRQCRYLRLINGQQAAGLAGRTVVPWRAATLIDLIVGWPGVRECRTAWVRDDARLDWAAVVGVGTVPAFGLGHARSRGHHRGRNAGHAAAPLASRQRLDDHEQRHEHAKNHGAFRKGTQRLDRQSRCRRETLQVYRHSELVPTLLRGRDSGSTAGEPVRTAARPQSRWAGDDSRTDAWRTDGSQPHSRRKNPPRGSTDGPLRGERRGCGASEKTGDLGFEPRLTESESVVLPLHQSPRHRNCIGFPRRVHSEAGGDFLVPITGWASALGRNRARSRG